MTYRWRSCHRVFVCGDSAPRPCRWRCRRQGLSIQHENHHSGRLRGRGRAFSAAPAAPAAKASTSGARAWRRAGGDSNVLLPIQHECHGRAHLRQTGRKVQHLFAGIGAIRQQPCIHTGKHQISRRRQCAPQARSQPAPPFRPCHGIPGDKDVAAALGSDRGYRGSIPLRFCRRLSVPRRLPGGLAERRRSRPPRLREQRTGSES